MSKEEITALKMKRLAMKRNTIKTLDDIEIGSDPRLMLGIKEDITKDITSGEQCQQWRNRNSVLQSSGKAGNIPVEYTHDHKDLLPFLNIESSTSINIDNRTTFETPTQIEHAQDLMEGDSSVEDMEIQREKQQCAERSLLDVMSKEEITALKMKRLVVKRNTIKSVDDIEIGSYPRVMLNIKEDITKGIVSQEQQWRVKQQLAGRVYATDEASVMVDNVESQLEAMSIEEITPLKMKRLAMKRNTVKTVNDIEIGSDPRVKLDIKEDITKDIVSQEQRWKHWRNRNSILQSSGKFSPQLKRAPVESLEGDLKKPRLEDMKVERVKQQLPRRLDASEETSVMVDKVKSLLDVMSIEEITVLKMKPLVVKRSTIKTVDDIEIGSYPRVMPDIKEDITKDMTARDKQWQQQGNINSILQSSGKTISQDAVTNMNKIKAREEDRHRLPAAAPIMTPRATTMKPVIPQPTLNKQYYREWFLKQEEDRHRLPAAALIMTPRATTMKPVIPQPTLNKQYYREWFLKQEEDRHRLPAAAPIMTPRATTMNPLIPQPTVNKQYNREWFYKQEEDRHRLPAAVPIMTPRATTIKPVIPQPTVYNQYNREWFLKQEEDRLRLPAAAPIMTPRATTMNPLILQPTVNKQYYREWFYKQEEDRHRLPAAAPIMTPRATTMNPVIPQPTLYNQYDREWFFKQEEDRHRLPAAAPIMTPRATTMNPVIPQPTVNKQYNREWVFKQEEDRHRLPAAAPIMTPRATTMNPLIPQPTMYNQYDREWFFKQEEDRYRLPAAAPIMTPRATTMKPVILQPTVYSHDNQGWFSKQDEGTAGFQTNTIESYHGNTWESVTEGNQPSWVHAPQPFPTAQACRRLLSKPKRRTPIIIVPNLTTSLITMSNAIDILQDMKFVSTDEKKMQCDKQFNETLLIRQKGGGTSVPYKVIDNPEKLKSEDWDRVVAVFVMGPVWQFKRWPWNGNPVEIFSKICGFHLKYDDMQLDKNVAGWDVSVIQLSRTKRHLDRAALKVFWERLDMYLIRNKRHLRF